MTVKEEAEDVGIDITKDSWQGQYATYCLGKSEKETAVKFDGAKPRTDLLPVVPLLKTASVFGYGAKKYNDYNYAKGDGLKWSRLYGATLRHMFAWWQGEDMDESGHNHLYHAICELLMLAHLQELGKTKGDDRIG